MNRMTLIDKGCEASPRNCYTSGNQDKFPDQMTDQQRRRLSTHNHQRRRPSFLSSLVDMLQPRSNTSTTSSGATSGLRRVQVAECSVDQVYDLRGKRDDFYDDETAFRRPRSNSSDFLILRKTSRPLSVSVVGLIDQQTDPYLQYMKVVDTYELCAQNSRIEVVDRMLSARKAFLILRDHQISSLLVWDSEKEEICSILTLTDFLICLRTEMKKKRGADVLVKDILSGNKLVSVDATEKILHTCEELHQNNLHRVAVQDDIGNMICVITVRRVLEVLHKQNRSLHFAQWLSRPIAMSTIGTWDAVNTVPSKSNILTAMEEMIGFRYSTMPIVNEKKDVIGVVTKKDIANALPLDHPNPREWMIKTKLEDILHLCTRQIFIESKNSIGSVLDTLLAGHCSTAFVIHNKKVIGAVSLTDFLGYILYPKSGNPNTTSTNDDGLPATPSSSGSSSSGSVNVRTMTK